MTLPFATATSISHNKEITSVGINFSFDMAFSLVRLRRNSINTPSGLETDVTVDFP